MLKVEINLKYVNTKEQLADKLTKGHNALKFQRPLLEIMRSENLNQKVSTKEEN